MPDEKVNFVLSAQDRATMAVKKLKGELGMLGGAGAKAAGPLGKLSAVTGGMVSPMALGVGAAVGLGAAFLNTAKGASDLAEEVDKSKVVFGPVSDEMVKFAEGASDIGLSTKAALGAAGAFGNMFNTVGIAQGASQDMSETMVKLAADMGSFNNVDPTEMLDKLRSGLSGEAEPLRRFGVLLSEASVKEYAFRKGIAEQGAVLTEAQKVTARYGLILEQTAIQQGNFADTSDGLANSQRRWQAVLENTNDEIGKTAASIELGAIKVADSVASLADQTGKDFSDILGFFTETQDWGVIIGQSREAVGEQMTAMELETQASALAAVRAVEEEYVKGLPVVANEAGKIAGLLPSEIQAKVDEVRKAGSDSVVAFAAGVLEKQQDPGLAWEAANEVYQTAMSRTEEIAKIQSNLSSAAFVRGINDRRPAVSLAFKAYASEAQERLKFLGADSYTYGSNIGLSYAAGIESQVGTVRNAAGHLAAAVEGQIAIKSEPKDADSPLRGITKWGGNIVKTMAEGIHHELRSAQSAAGALGGALVPSMGSGATAYAGAGMGYGGGGVTINFNSNLPYTEASKQAIVQELLPAITREQSRQGLR